MPLYEFTCTACGTTFEELVATALETRGVTCAECGSEEIEKLVSRIASAGASGPDRGGSCGPGPRRFT